VTGGIVEFLTAQYDLEQAAALAAAKEASAADGRDGTRWRMSDEGLYCEWASIACGPYGHLGDDVGNHMAAWDPARVLAEIAAKRALLSRAQALLCEHDWFLRGIGEDIYHDLAAPYVDRPGWNEAWRVG
jgi:Family of unknown function (DUF6221)